MTANMKSSGALGQLLFSINPLGMTTMGSLIDRPKTSTDGDAEVWTCSVLDVVIRRHERGVFAGNDVGRVRVFAPRSLT